MSFWDWFIRPFAEAAAGLAAVFGFIAVWLVIVGVLEAKRRVKKWWKR